MQMRTDSAKIREKKNHQLFCPIIANMLINVNGYLSIFVKYLKLHLLISLLTTLQLYKQQIGKLEEKLLIHTFLKMLVPSSKQSIYCNGCIIYNGRRDLI